MILADDTHEDSHQLLKLQEWPLFSYLDKNKVKGWTQL